MRTGRHGWRALAGSLCLSAACQCGSTGTPTTTALADDNDRVALGAAAGPAVVEVDGEGRGPKCLRNQVFQGSGTIDLNDRIENKVSCPSEVAAFSRSRAIELNGAPAWSHDATKPLQLTMPPPVTVALRLYVPSAMPLAAQAAKDEMDLATALVAENRGGLAFSNPAPVVYSPAQGTMIGNGCGNVANLVAAGPALYDPAAINVYYVSVIDQSNVYMGYDCYEWPMVFGGASAIAENVIYISIYNRAPTTLTHELGHALALRDNVGHTNGIAGFTTLNLMLSGISWGQQAAQHHFSLGQGYRMSLDRLSWLNHPRPNGGPAVRAGANRGCQLTALRATGDPCPTLVLDP